MLHFDQNKTSTQFSHPNDNLLPWPYDPYTIRPGGSHVTLLRKSAFFTWKVKWCLLLLWSKKVDDLSHVILVYLLRDILVLLAGGGKNIKSIKCLIDCFLYFFPRGGLFVFCSCDAWHTFLLNEKGRPRNEPGNNSPAALPTMFVVCWQPALRLLSQPLPPLSSSCSGC